MGLKNRLQHLCSMGISVLLMCIFMGTNVHASQLAYQEEASDVIMNSLQGEGSQSFLKKLYGKLFFVPLWMHEKELSTPAKELFAHIKNDGTLDKTGKLYQDALLLKSLTKEVYSIKKVAVVSKVDLEFKISQLYEAYTNYAYLGSINWGAFSARISNLMVNEVSTEWVLHRPSINPFSMAEKVAFGASLGKALHDAIPNKYHYKALQKELTKYRKIQAKGGWLPVVLKKALKPKKSAEGVYGLRERLRLTGDYIPCDKNTVEGFVYNKCLQKAVKHFQKRNGLSADAEVGSSTLKILNISVEERITILQLNLDRIKWLKKRNAKRRVIINIPDFMLYFEEDGKLRQSIKTVVGKPKNPTPIFSNTVETIVLNPYWNLPKSIIQKEMIPKLIRNPNAMKKKGIEIYDGWGKNAKRVKASSVDWAQYMYSKKVPYRFAQIPGPRNALGKLKFLFPNKFAVYMHDTPAKKLFRKNKRAFSHGCIRLQKPRELLKTFASFNENLDFNASKKVLNGKKKTFISLQQKVPVDVIYLTAWVDYDGKLQFRNDIYNYDKMQLKSFRRW